MVAMTHRPPQKPKINLAMLPELLEAFKETTGKYGERRKWQVSSAAAYLWLKLSDEERDELAALMWNADGDREVRDQILAEIRRTPTVYAGNEADPIRPEPPLDAQKPSRRRKR